MKKKTKRKATVNIRIYKDTHDVLKKHSDEYRQSLSGLVHSLAMGLVATKRKTR